MREKVENEGRRVGFVPLAAWSLTAIMSVAIAGNALFWQNSPGHIAQAAIDPAALDPAAEAQGDLAPPGVRTIQLKFDPIVEAVQRELMSAGYYKGPVDGVNGRKTRQAIAAYQQAMGLAPDGQPSSDLAEHIRFTREVSEASLFTGTVAAAPDAEQRAAIRRVQTGLADLAYSPGAINGELTRETRDAILAFQRDHKMPETGEVSDELIAELAKVSGQAEAGSEPATDTTTQ